MSTLIAGTDWIWKGTAMTTAGGAQTSQWYRMNELNGGQIYAVVESTGATTYTLVAHVSPVEYSDSTLDPADHYVAATVAAAGTAKTAAFHALPTEMQSPFCQVRFVITPAVADATGVYVGVCRNVAGC